MRLMRCKDQIKREDGLDPDEGGIDVPESTDGITRYPSQWMVHITQMMLQNYDGQASR